mmetsp:Transcript_27805/g.64823  ORF Transcript_27805/g.64823 Transcript_27805/m.64823 type:complete len:192 (+) Transcript_27805:96-671(+)
MASFLRPTFSQLVAIAMCVGGIDATTTACSDKTAVPQGHWVVYNLSDTTLPDQCKNIPVLDVADEICCTSDLASMNPWNGRTFQNMVTENDYDSCMALGPGMNLYTRCNSDGSIDYGEQCDSECTCDSRGTYTGGSCSKQNDIGDLIFFMKTTGCACPSESTDGTVVGADCGSKVFVLVGLLAGLVWTQRL